MEFVDILVPYVVSTDKTGERITFIQWAKHKVFKWDTDKIRECQEVWKDLMSKGCSEMYRIEQSSDGCGGSVIFGYM